MLSLRIIVCLCCLIPLANAQQCDTSRTISTPLDDFFVNDDGTVTELESGLTWMRCTLGQSWDGVSCKGDAIELSWKEAFKRERQINEGAGYAGLRNWRLPTLSEIAKIVERQCNLPRINLTLFPETPSAVFWTANHKKGKVEHAFAMDFEKSGLKVIHQKETLYVRLVSGRN